MAASTFMGQAVFVKAAAAKATVNKSIVAAKAATKKVAASSGSPWYGEDRPKVRSERRQRVPAAPRCCTLRRQRARWTRDRRTARGRGAAARPRAAGTPARILP
jgi:hypothetical protein